MGRPSRFRLPGIPQLITQRGHNRLPCFLEGADYSEFRKILQESADSAACDVHGLLMLPTAYWVLANPAEGDGIARMMQRTGRCYVRYFNKKYRREGTMWASRYRACLIEPKPDSLQMCVAYLEHTPARAGVVAPGTTWPWLFLENSNADKNSLGDEEAFKEISSILDKGLVYGSDHFRKRIALEAGVRTEPGVRGRPRKQRDVKK
jgi:REP element-mobilizing transposase RayT